MHTNENKQSESYNKYCGVYCIALPFNINNDGMIYERHYGTSELPTADSSLLL
jgi:hypothetical protein